MPAPKTAARPNFFERLAPGARMASPAVRALLPPRFGSSQLVSSQDDEGFLPSPQVSEREGGTSAAVAFVPREARPREAATETRGVPAEVSAVPTGAPRDLPRAVRASPPEFVQRPKANNDAASPSPPLMSAPAEHAPTAERREPLPPALERIVHSRTFVELAKPALEVRPPLREATIAERSTASNDRPATIVEVTIDRVDVHVPSPIASSGPKPTPKPRAPSLALGDYLRQGARSGEGGRRT